MGKQISFGSMFVGSATSPGPEAAEERSDSPFRILLLANLSGGQQMGMGGTIGDDLRQPVFVDRDNLDDVLARIGPTLSLPGIHPDGSTIEIEFVELDDFHPDRLYDRLELFADLRSLHERLGKPATFAAAAEELRQLGVGGRRSDFREDSDDDRGTAEDAPVPTVSGEDLLEQMLGPSEGSTRRVESSREASEFQRILAKVAEPHRIAPDDPRKQELIELVDALIADRMRAILHHPDFRALEAAWRGVHLLTRRIETEANLKIYLLDWAKESLAADLDGVASLREASLHKLLVERPPGSPRWGVVAADYEFAATQPDIEMLGRIAQIAAKAGTPFLAGASSTVFGCPSVAAAPDPDDWREPDETAAAMWQQLRRLPQASSLGLAAPRLLLRLPYGPESSPLERFDFEEIPAPRHESYLWGNPSLACVCLLAQTFSETGWEMEGRLYRDLTDLPTHVFDDDGQPRVKPCAEAVLLDRAVERILDSGIMPLQSFVDRGAVRLVRLQSLADPPAALAGLS